MEAYGHGGTGSGAEGKLVFLDDGEVARGGIAALGFGALRGEAGAGHVSNELGDVGEDFGDDTGLDVEGGFVEGGCDSARVELEADFESDAEDALEDHAV